jgi:EpsI family protein
MKISLKHLLTGLAMLAAAGLAIAMTPTHKIADQGPKLNLETMIPKQFGEWKMDETIVPLLADPKQTAMLNKIYNQTLSRTYINTAGERIMLSIAYGGDQSDGMAVHKPEVCYPAQGFQILKNSTDAFSTGNGSIPVKRLVATQGKRIEPITYWTTVGDTVAVSSLKWKLSQLKYGLTGKIPDGLLFRISSIQADDAVAYKMQDDFARTLLGALTPSGRKRLIGQPSPTT